MWPQNALFTSKAGKESDIFNYGVVASELACGRRSIDLGAKESQVRMMKWVWDMGWGNSLKLQTLSYMENLTRNKWNV